MKRSDYFHDSLFEILQLKGICASRNGEINDFVHNYPGLDFSRNSKHSTWLLNM